MTIAVVLTLGGNWAPAGVAVTHEQACSQSETSVTKKARCTPVLKKCTDIRKFSWSTGKAFEVIAANDIPTEIIEGARTTL